MAQTIYTIGFTRKDLRTFMQLLQDAKVEKIVDVRLQNTLQLAGYAKRDDLEFILETFGISYIHVPELAPTKEILSRYKRDQDWESYQNSFNQLLEQRDAVALWQAQFSDDKRVCLLCSEHEPEQCHRRLVAEYIKHGLPDITVEHLF